VAASGGGDFSALNSTLAAARDELLLFFSLSIQNAPPKLAYLEDAARALCVCLRFANLALFQQNKMVMKSQTKSVVASKRASKLLLAALLP
jgi:hypothetical protein